MADTVVLDSDGNGVEIGGKRRVQWFTVKAGAIGDHDRFPWIPIPKPLRNPSSAVVMVTVRGSSGDDHFDASVCEVTTDKVRIDLDGRGGRRNFGVQFLIID